jgi:DNA repair ATPase RecN
MLLFVLFNKCNANMTENWRNYSQLNSLKIQKSTLQQFFAEKEKILKSDLQILQELNHSEGEFFELEG